jgi:mutator protein MutT
MEISFRQTLNVAMSQTKLTGWRSPLDVPNLDRPQKRPSDLPGDGKVAAVLALFCDQGNDEKPDSLPTMPDLLLTQRAINLTNHGGQISFPGGRLEPGESTQQAAIRETEEEIGVHESKIELFGQLTSVYIPPSDFTVTPYVGVIRGEPNFKCCPREVEKIVRAPLNQLMEPEALTSGMVTRSNGETLKVPCYRIGGHQIWGATAIMVGELVERLRRAGGAPTILADHNE